MVLILTDEQVVDGVVGGSATVFAFMIKSKFKKDGMNGAIVAGLAWAMVWYLRKLFHNLYASIVPKKDRRGIHFKGEKVMAAVLVVSVIVGLLGYVYFSGVFSEFGPVSFESIPWVLVLVIVSTSILGGTLMPIS